MVWRIKNGKKISKDKSFSVFVKEVLNDRSMIYLTLIKYNHRNHETEDLLYVEIGRGDKKFSFYIDININSEININVCQGKVKITKYEPDGNEVRVGETKLDEIGNMTYKIEIERKKDHYLLRRYGSSKKKQKYVFWNTIKKEK